MCNAVKYDPNDENVDYSMLHIPSYCVHHENDVELLGNF